VTAEELSTVSITVSVVIATEDTADVEGTVIGRVGGTDIGNVGGTTVIGSVDDNVGGSVAVNVGGSVGGDTVGGEGFVNSTFFGEGCGVITLGGTSLGEVESLLLLLDEESDVEEEDSTLVEQTGCRDENIKLKGSELYVGSSLIGMSFSLFVFDLSNASKSFCDVKVVILFSIFVVSGVTSTEKSVGSAVSCPWKHPFTHF